MNNKQVADNLVNDDDDPFSFEHSDFRNLLIFLRKSFDLPNNSYCNVVNVSPVKMQKLNKRHRGVDQTTDVLSFSSLDYPSITKLQELSKKEKEYCFGEILLSTKTIRDFHAQNSLATELHDDIMICLIHGYLHLLGYTHGNSNEKEPMILLQNKLYKEYKQLHD